jgi:glycosyltransferase involved in cell wall biosynthesis
MKVMHIIARLNIGGAAASVILTADHLRRYETETCIVCGRVGENEGDMAYLAEKHNITPHILPELGREINPVHDLKVIWQLVKYMRDWQPDVVHTHTAKAGVVGRLAAWIARVPVRVHTFHGHVFHGYFSPRKTQFYLTLERLMARLSTRIIAVSRAQQADLTTRYHIAPPEKFAVLEYGFDLTPLTQAPSPAAIDAVYAHYNLPRDRRLVGIIGRLVPIKHHDLFLDAAEHIAGERADVHFVIAGDGERRAELEARVKSAGLQDRVTFTGWIRDVLPLFYALDLMVLTSKNEGTPVSIIEGMAAGLPVISTDVGGVTDILDGGKLGTVVPPGDADALAQAMRRALDGDHPDATAAQEAVLARFDIAPRAQEIRDFYSRLF